MTHDFVFQLDENSNKPIFLNLASVIVREIERRRLKPGDPLPGTRKLARRLRIHRNTVDAAYQELILQGWLVAEPSRGTFVAEDLPEVVEPYAAAERIADPAWDTPPSTDGTVVLTDGAPDPRIMPRAELARAFRRALSAPAFISSAGYGDPRGDCQLKIALADYLIDGRGLAVHPADILVTRGSQMALFLVARALLDADHAIAVEDPGYRAAWSCFRATGARVVRVPVDGQGLSVEHLARLADETPNLKAVYITPHHQYPTTVTLGAGRRLKLLELARRRNLTIIEDDYDHDYRFDGRPILPLAARADTGLDIVYVGSLSKLLAPCIRLGYVVAKSHILKRMAKDREIIDRQGDITLEHAVAGLITDGELRRHVNKARRIYVARRRVLAEEIRHRLGDSVAFDLPAGGLAIWLKVVGGNDAEAWAKESTRLGVTTMPGSDFAFAPKYTHNAFRLGYANLDETEIRHVVDVLAHSRPGAGG